MKIIYEQKIIEQVFTLLNNLTVQGIQNNQVIASIAVLLQQNEIDSQKDENTEMNADEKD